MRLRKRAGWCGILRNQNVTVSHHPGFHLQLALPTGVPLGHRFDSGLGSQQNGKCTHIIVQDFELGIQSQYLGQLPGSVAQVVDPIFAA